MTSVKGPAVYLDYDQAGLDAAYDQNVYAPNREQIGKRNVANSAAARARIGEPEHHAYGATPVEYVEVFRTQRANAPIFVFVRGGAWRATAIDRYAFIAETLVNAGAVAVLVQYTGVEEAGGSLLPLADQVRRAIAWTHKNAVRIGGDPDRIFVGGHSSGAHMTGVVTITDWAAYGLPADAVKGALCCSGMYELEAVRLSARSGYVNFDDAMVDALSTQRHLDRIRMPLVVAYGTYETPEFQRQPREFVAALQTAGKPVKLIVGEGYNHFELIETLGSPYGLIGRAALEMMGLRAP